MEDAKNTAVAELIISEGKAYHFNDENCDETLIIKKVGDEFQIENKLFPLNKIMKHPHRNKFLNDIGMSWLHQHIAYPELYVTTEIFTDILTKKIPDVLSLSHKLLLQYNLYQYIDSKAFLELVLSNIQIDTRERLSAACQLMKVKANTANNTELKLHIQEIINSPKRANLIGNYADAGIKIDLTKSTYELETEWRDVQVSYEGDIQLPEHFFLCISREDFRKLNSNDWFINKSGALEYLMCKKKFYIGCISNEKILFEVEALKNTSWFSFTCISAHEKNAIDNETVDLGYALAKEINQEFFRNNYCNTNPLNLGNSMNSITGLLDSVI